MSTLITLVLFAMISAYFATQNSGLLNIRLANYTFSGIPLYLVVLGSMLGGLIIAWIVNIIESISKGLTIFKKNQTIKAKGVQVDQLEQRIHDLELENAQLKKGSVLETEGNSLPDKLHHNLG